SMSGSPTMGSQQIGSDTGTSWAKVISGWFTSEDLDLDVELKRLFEAICPVTDGSEGISPDQAFTDALDLVLGSEEVRLRTVLLEILAFRVDATRKETSPARVKSEGDLPTGNVTGPTATDDVVILDDDIDAKSIRESRKEVESVKIIDGICYSGFTDTRSFPSWRRKFYALCDSRGYNDYVLRYYALTKNIADNVQLRLRPRAPPPNAPAQKWKEEYDRLMKELEMLTAGLDGDTGSWKSEQELLALRQS
ncbi:hypothetical protein FOZ61_003843, partial [Perkinsus olseni]